MALFIVERNLAEELELSGDDIMALDDISASLEIRWLSSFLSADKKKTYCLYEASDAEALLAHAAKVGLPADSIIEVSTIDPQAVRADAASGSQTTA